MCTNMCTNMCPNLCKWFCAGGSSWDHKRKKEEKEKRWAGIVFLLINLHCVKAETPKPENVTGLGWLFLLFCLYGKMSFWSVLFWESIEWVVVSLTQSMVESTNKGGSQHRIRKRPLPPPPLKHLINVKVNIALGIWINCDDYQLAHRLKKRSKCKVHTSCTNTEHMYTHSCTCTHTHTHTHSYTYSYTPFQVLSDAGCSIQEDQSLFKL